jgi:hypothetical protein
MKRLLFDFSVATTLFVTTTLLADDSELLTGKWSVKKSNEGQNFTQTVEIKKDKFVFQVLGPDNQVVLYAEGDVKFEKVGPFNSVHFLHIRGGQSADSLQEVDDERINPYVLDGDTWMLASNFDKDRDQKPTVDVYQRVKASSQNGTLVIDEIEMADTPQGATWFFCFEAKVEGVNRRYYVENKGYDKNQVTIPTTLALPNVQAGQKCSFKMQLDDIDGDACSDEPDNKSTGEFSVSEHGSQSYKPEDHWRYTIRWHLK